MRTGVTVITAFTGTFDELVTVNEGMPDTAVPVAASPMLGSELVQSNVVPGTVVPKVIAPELVILILSVGEDAPSAVVLNTKRPG